MVWVEHCVSGSGRKLAPCAPLFRAERVFIVDPAHGGGNLPSPRGRSDCAVFSCSPEVLAKIAVVGWFTSWFWRGDRISFEEMFYGDWSYHNFSLVRHVGFGQLTIVLLGVMLALFLVSRSEDIDSESIPHGF